MASEQLPLGGTGVRRRRGIARTQLDRTLSAWKRDDQLTGDEYAAARSVLRDAAEAVDAARHQLRDGQGSAYTLAMCLRTYAELLEQLGPDREGSDDGELRAFLAGLGAPAVSD